MKSNLCAHLQPIEAAEMRRGNELETIAENAFDRCDLLVLLQKPFSGSYEQIIDTSKVVANTNSDAHYPIGKTYYCREDRKAIFAPI